MVDVASRRPSSSSSFHQRRGSPSRSPRRSPAQCHRQSSPSPSLASKRVRFDSLAPSSAMKSPRKSHFRDWGSCPSPCRVGGCLAAYWGVWESQGAEPWVVQVLREGYILPFHSHPPPSSTLIPLPSYSPSSIKGLALVAAVKDLLSKGAIEPASPGPGFYSRLFVTPKVTGGWRPVIDLSCLNRFIRLAHFRMETAQSVLQSIRSGDWMISLYLQDAYLQVPVHPQSRRYLRFCLGDQVYQFRVLCFGLSSAPQVFTRVMALVSSVMHRSGFRILLYLDDWLVLGSSLQEITRARDFLLALCAELGIQVNLLKSSLTPSQRLDYLGMTLQSSPLRTFPTQARVHKVRCLVDEFSSSHEQPLSL